MLVDTMTSPSRTAFAALKRFVGDRPDRERCELCGASISAGHQHLVEPAKRRFLCSCDPCATLFAGHIDARYRALPRRVVRLVDFQLDDALWDALMIPINMAFFTKLSTDGRVVAHYPGPAGATESLLELSAWRLLEEKNAVLGDMVPEVESLLVNRVGGANDSYLVPVDLGYRLSGLIRLHWRGLSGGAEAWEEIGRFFEWLNVSAQRQETAHA